MGVRHGILPAESGLRQEVAETDYDHADPVPFWALADWLEERHQDGSGYRRLGECIQAGALLSAWRVTPTWESGISPPGLADRVAAEAGLLVADGREVRFVCGPAAGVVGRHPDVDKADRYPALRAGRLPVPYRTASIRQLLWRAAFNTARLERGHLFVFQSLDALVSALSFCPGRVVV